MNLLMTSAFNSVTGEFLQQKVITDNGLRSMIRVRDKNRMLEALWEPPHFLEWVNRLREYESDSTIQDFLDSRDNWEAFEDNQLPEDSLDTTRISINLTPIKKQLNESLLQLSINGSFFESPTDETHDSVVTKRREDIKSCLLQMEIAAKTLDKLCHYESPEISKQVTKSLSNVNKTLTSLKKTLNFVNPDEKTADNIFIKNNLHFNDKTGKSPRTLKCPLFQENAGKTVRFNFQ